MRYPSLLYVSKYITGQLRIVKLSVRLLIEDELSMDISHVTLERLMVCDLFNYVLLGQVYTPG